MDKDTLAEQEQQQEEQTPRKKNIIDWINDFIDLIRHARKLQDIVRQFEKPSPVEPPPTQPSTLPETTPLEAPQIPTEAIPESIGELGTAAEGAGAVEAAGAGAAEGAAVVGGEAAAAAGGSAAAVGATGAGAAAAGGAAAATGGATAAVAGGTAVAGGAAAVGGGTIALIIGIILLVIILIVIIVLIILNLVNPSTPTPVTPVIGTDISSCTFYNGDARVTRSFKFGNPSITSFIVEVANKIDIPPPMIAAIMSREREDIVTNPSTIIFTGDYDPRRSSPSDPTSATGAMQIQPRTFRGAFLWATNTIDPETERIYNAFGKTNVSIDIDRHTPAANDPVLRIASIKDSIILGAYELKRLKLVVNGRGAWDETTVRTVAGKYHGGEASTLAAGCSLGYCDHVWKSFSECRPSVPVPSGVPAETVDIVRMVNAVREDPACVDSFTSSNYNRCLARIPTDITNYARVISEIRTSVYETGTSTLQCVGFAKASTAALNNPPLDPPAPLPGAAFQYRDRHSFSYVFIPVTLAPPQPGDIPIWSYAPGIRNSGHIGVIVAIYPDGKIQIADANWNGPGKMQLRNFAALSAVIQEGMEGYLRKQP